MRAELAANALHVLRAHANAVELEHAGNFLPVGMGMELQPLANRDAVLRLRDGTPVRASRTYIEPLIRRLRGDMA